MTLPTTDGLALNEHPNEHPDAPKIWRQKKWLGGLQWLVELILTGYLLGFKINTIALLVQRCTSNRYLAVLILVAGLGVGYRLATVGFELYEVFYLNRKYQLSNVTLKLWFTDQIKGSLLMVLLGVPLLVGFLLIINYFQANWWWISALGITVFSVLLTRLAPQFLLPLFFKLKSLANSELEQRLKRLASQTNTRLLGLFEINLSLRTNLANAAVVGFGNSRKAIIGDTLLKEFSLDQAEFVLAHELGHHHYQDLWWGVALASVLSFISLAGAQIFLNHFWGEAFLALDLKVFFYFLIYYKVVQFLGAPFHNGFSRFIERRADRFALAATQNAKAGIEAFQKLGFQNKARFEPPALEVFWMHSHPPLAQRIRLLANKVK